MQRKGISIASALLLTIGTVAAAQEATPAYRLTHVWTRSLDPGHENEEFEVHGINDKGQLAGHRVPQGAFVWRNGAFENLAPFASPLSWAFGINEWSDVAGSYVNAAEDSSAFLRRGATLVQIGQLPGEFALAAVHLNNRREVLLQAFGNEGSGYFVWRRGERVPLANPPGRNATPVRINDAGVVVGSAFGGGAIPVMWQNGAVMPIGLPEGATQGFARDINDAGVVLVDADAGPEVQRSHRWREGQYTVLDVLAQHSRTSARGINNVGVVVGSSSGEPSNFTTATVWYEVQAHDLNALVQANDPLKPFVRLSVALHVNDRGEIVARGLDERQGTNTVSHYLLTPRF